MRYFFQSGTFQDLSYAELLCVLESYGISKDSLKNVGGGIYLLENNNIKEDVVKKIFGRLGGYIRFGIVVEDLDSFLPSFNDFKKITFGISFISNEGGDRQSIVKLSNDVKRYFKSLGISSRFLIPKENQLNEAQIRNNDLLEEGFEFCIFDTTNGQMYGRTVAVQDVQGFVHRDLDKPVSDYEMGVLPQKLARMMCNLTSQKDGILWDPFCGSGTVLMEASLLGFDILGTDVDTQAVQNTDKNIQWLRDEGLITGIKYNLFPLDIHNVEKRIVKDLKRTGINSVVCEPFMGPAQRKELTESKAEILLEDVQQLYISLFKILNEIARSGFKVVLVIPSYKTLKGERTINISQFAEKKWDVLNKKYTKGDLKWRRNNSIITRNIFILSKR
jgi:tRNA G10  N-methylase Trm11